MRKRGRSKEPKGALIVLPFFLFPNQSLRTLMVSASRWAVIENSNTFMRGTYAVYPSTQRKVSRHLLKIDCFLLDTDWFRQFVLFDTFLNWFEIDWVIKVIETPMLYRIRSYARMKHVLVYYYREVSLILSSFLLWLFVPNYIFNT